MSPEKRLALVPYSGVRGDIRRGRWAPLATIGTHCVLQAPVSLVWRGLWVA